MIIIPAIDIIDGKVVRLVEGDYNQKTIYNDDPVKIAKEFKGCGAELIHIVDLDGAKSGNAKNKDVVKEIKKNVDIKIEFGGGIRSNEIAQELIALGVDRLIIGTKAVEDLNFVESLIGKYENKIVIGIDARDGIVKTDGWLKGDDIKVIEFVEDLKKIGVLEIIYTDISKDGKLSGVNILETKNIKDVSKMNVIASGGVKDMSDIIKIKDSGIDGVIVGKALYEKRIDLREAIQIVR